MAKLWEFVMLANGRTVFLNLVAVSLALVFGTIQAAAITCDSSPVTTCTGAVEEEVYPGNIPSYSLNGSLSLVKFDNYNATTFTFGSTVAGAAGNYAPYFSFENLTATTGDWEFDPVSAALAGLDLWPTILAIKAANDWAIINIALGDTTGSWSTTLAGLTNPQGIGQDLSHLTFFDGSRTGVVPLPPALILFGSALIGLTLLGRRRLRGTTA